jgi:glycine/D-amino acid oxidase-like deaminating enzyme
VAATYDLAIIGGGINGCGIARGAAGRGLAVYLCEMSDLASGTSSRSTKLIHGGLRYLEYGDLRLVREALREREVLWRLAPHVIRPMRRDRGYRHDIQTDRSCCCPVSAGGTPGQPDATARERRSPGRCWRCAAPEAQLSKAGMAHVVLGDSLQELA